MFHISTCSILNIHYTCSQAFKWQVKEARPLFHSAGPEYAPVIYEQPAPEVDVRSEASSEDVAARHYEEDAPTTRHYQQPEVERDPDVVTAETPANEDELPPPAFTRSLLAKFKSLEDVNRPPPTPDQSAKLQRHALEAVKPSPKASRAHYSLSVSDRSDSADHLEISADDASGSYQQEAYAAEYYQAEQERSRAGSSIYDDLAEGGEYENEPVVNSDVVREQDRDDEAELPEQGIARNLMARWQQLQQQ